MKFNIIQIIYFSYTVIRLINTPAIYCDTEVF